MPGLIRGMARTAVVAGTATAVSGRVAAARTTAGRSRKKSSTPSSRPRPRPPPAAAGRPPRAAEGSVIDQLKELGELKAQGILTEEEFAAQKAKLLG